MFIIKFLKRVGMEKIYLNIIMITYDKPTANSILHGAQFETISFYSETRTCCSLSLLCFNTVLKPPAGEIGTGKEIKGI